MHRRFISTVAMLMVMTLGITGCTSEASNVGMAKNKEQAVDTGFTVTTAGSYDSADTAVVISTDQENSAVVFMNMETGKQYTLYYDGTTYVKDKHDGPMTISQIEPGDVVDVTFLKGKKRLASIKRSPEAWVYDEIENYDLGGANKTASIGSTTYSLPDDVVVLSEGRRSEVMDVVAQDVLTISGIDHKIYSINVERGHGYLRLKNDQALIGGWIEVGNSVIREITEDMLLVVPEGSYQVLLSNKGTSCMKEVVINRDKEVVLDVGDLEIAENKTGRILFSVTPDTAKVTVDGKAVDISKAVELPYGIHQVHLEAKGYDSLTKYIQVGSEYASISFELEEEREEEDRRTVSANTIDDYQSETSQVSNESTLSSLSENTLSATSGNRVYIDSPRDVEVYVDGNYIGLSPVSFGKTVGSHTVTLRKNGYKTRSYTIYLYNDGKDTTYSFSDLEQETVSGNTTKPNGSVSENSLVTVHIEEPKDVEVYVEGELIGISPVSFQREAGTYEVTLCKEGYETESHPIELKPGATSYTYKWGELEEDSGEDPNKPLLVTVHIEEPEDVEVYVEGELIGTSPLSFQREASKYEVTFSKEGYKTKSYTFDLTTGKTDFTYRLGDLEEDSEENPNKPPVTSGGSTQTPGDSSTDSTQTPGNSSTDSTQTPGNSSTDSTQTPGEDSADSTQTPGEDSADSTQTPGDSSADSTQTPDDSSADNTQTPGEGSADSTQTPDDSSTDSTQTPENTTNNTTQTDDKKDSDTTQDTTPTKTTTERIVQNSNSRRKR